MLHRASLTAALLALLVPMGLAAAPVKKKAVNPDAALFAQAKRETAAILRDPASAQFRNLRIVTTILDTKKVCGEVNARNGFGGYTGFTPFVFYGRAAILTLSPDIGDYTSIADGC